MKNSPEPVITETVFRKQGESIKDLLQDAGCIVKKSGVWRHKSFPAITTTKDGMQIQIDYEYSKDGWSRLLYRYIE